MRVRVRARFTKTLFFPALLHFSPPTFFGLVRPSSLSPLLFPHLVSTQPPPYPDIPLNTAGELGLEPPRSSFAFPPASLAVAAGPAGRRSTESSSHCPRRTFPRRDERPDLRPRGGHPVGLDFPRLSFPVPLSLARFFRLERKSPGGRSPSVEIPSSFHQKLTLAGLFRGVDVRRDPRLRGLDGLEPRTVRSIRRSSPKRTRFCRGRSSNSCTTENATVTVVVFVRLAARV